MNLIKTTLPTIGLAILLAIPVSLAAQPGPPDDGPPMPPGRWWRIPRVAQRVDLTDAEKQRLDTLFVESRRKMIDRKNDVERQRFELELALDGETFSEKEATDRFNAFTAARSALAAERFRFLIEVRKLLGFERFQTLKSMFESHRQKRMERQRRPDRPGRRQTP